MMVLHVQCYEPAAQMHPEISSCPQQAPREPSCSLRKSRPANGRVSESSVSEKHSVSARPSVVSPLIQCLNRAVIKRSVNAQPKVIRNDRTDNRKNFVCLLLDHSSAMH